MTGKHTPDESAPQVPGPPAAKKTQATAAIRARAPPTAAATSVERFTSGPSVLEPFAKAEMGQ